MVVSLCLRNCWCLLAGEQISKASISYELHVRSSHKSPVLLSSASPGCLTCPPEGDKISAAKSLYIGAEITPNMDSRGTRTKEMYYSVRWVSACLFPAHFLCQLIHSIEAYPTMCEKLVENSHLENKSIGSSLGWNRQSLKRLGLLAGDLNINRKSFVCI